MNKYLKATIIIGSALLLIAATAYITLFVSKKDQKITSVRGSINWEDYDRFLIPESSHSLIGIKDQDAYIVADGFQFGAATVIARPDKNLLIIGDRGEMDGSYFGDVTRIDLKNHTFSKAKLENFSTGGSFDQVILSNRYLLYGEPTKLHIYDLIEEKDLDVVNLSSLIQGPNEALADATCLSNHGYQWILPDSDSSPLIAATIYDLTKSVDGSGSDCHVLKEWRHLKVYIPALN